MPLCVTKWRRELKFRFCAICILLGRLRVMGNTGPGRGGNIPSSIYVSISTCLSKTDSLMVTDSPRAGSSVCQVPGGSVTCVRDNAQTCVVPVRI